MQNSHPERGPPGVELLHPLVHDCSWAYDDGRTQTHIPTTKQAVRKGLIGALQLR